MMKTNEISLGFGSPRALVVAIAALASLAGCGGEVAANKPPDTGGADSSTSGGNGGANFEAEIGALDQDKVQSTLQRTSDKLSACFHNGVRRIPFMGGEIKFALRIAQGGTATVAYLKESTLGDRETESCMLGALRSASWPSPVGGKEGLAEGGFAFDPSADERPPVALAPDRLGKELPKAKQALATCRASQGAGPITATMYLDTDGKPLAVGISSADPKGDAAAKCVVDALRGMNFPSPGSYAGKVSLVAE
ncbi:AgmX/PglI C-terminal domain-containing protein [Polyangium sp. 15x6]|uniref:AgmX/PglI C-terminal domain-containing protein n=1 Tax=Polyangium sp. 15x6 TaxID=3042687 RepID=UPI00249CD11B|nr:AgmX/PglI C-terminal domain-containing protein [Polyangium sp. 15x6]MDI3290108.1 AgmX/PglI C-terminal domain-containing protein [Polyangium sp. 15x6]